ncbi:hypothetical protein [Methanobrevibacter sp. V74]|uniref:hypothetical protein n=1 Tax=Methanobrevibacter sp. V74 TaxID=3064279 RepID=UPI0027353D68|nr:hypothetical protein [Methanobrevibacter sp. V74]
MNKKFVLLTIFIVSLLAVTAVTAIENNENSMTGLSESDLLDSENNIDKISSRDHDDDDDDDDDFSAVGNKKKESDLEIDSKIVKSGKKVKITSYIFDDETDKIAKTAKGKVSLKVDGKKYSAKVKNGKFSITFKAPSKAKRYVCKVKYSGDSKYRGDSTTFNLIVKKSATKSKYVNIKVAVKNNKYVTKYSGKYKIKTYQKETPKGFKLKIYVYKNGKIVNPDNYLSKVHFKNKGQWKWSNWDDGEDELTYHDYWYYKSVKTDKVMVKLRK